MAVDLLVLWLLFVLVLTLMQAPGESAAFLRRRRAAGILPALAGHPRRGVRKPAWVVARLIRLKALMPAVGCRPIADVFNRRYADRMSVSKSYVAEVLRRHAYEVAVVRRRIKHRLPRPLPINRVWGFDLTGKQDMNGEIHSILDIVDHGSRRLLSCAYVRVPTP